MNLHAAEWAAGELIAFTLAALALASVIRQHRSQERERRPMTGPERDFWYSDPDPDDGWAELQAESLAAADVDWDAREMSD